jgi:hypothetical protein
VLNTQSEVTKSQIISKFGQKGLKRVNSLEGFQFIRRVIGEYEEAWISPEIFTNWGLTKTLVPSLDTETEAVEPTSSFILHPWTNLVGEIDESLLASVTNMLVCSITKNPGISEKILLEKSTMFLREGARKEILRGLELQDIIYSKILIDPEPVSLFSDPRKTINLKSEVNNESDTKIYFAHSDLIFKLDGVLNFSIMKNWASIKATKMLNNDQDNV